MLVTRLGSHLRTGVRMFRTSARVFRDRDPRQRLQFRTSGLKEVASPSATTNAVDYTDEELMGPEGAMMGRDDHKIVCKFSPVSGPQFEVNYHAHGRPNVPQRTWLLKHQTWLFLLQYRKCFRVDEDGKLVPMRRAQPVNILRVYKRGGKS